MASKICPRCGTEQNAQFKFCKNCGALLSNENKENINRSDEDNFDSVFEEFIKEEKDYSEAFINDDIKQNNTAEKKSEFIKRCPECGEEIGNENFCIHCGTKLNQKVKRCIKCGSIIYSMAKTCPKCGHVTMQKDPVFAAALSFFLPGVGQIYTRQIKKGIIIILGIMASSILLVIGIGIFTGFIIWIYSIYNAFSIAKAINQGKVVN